MQKRKMLFVYNPKAGKARIRNHLLDIINIFTKGGYEVTAVPTQAAGDAIQIVRDRDDIYDMVVCSGGDGTLDEVVTGMLQGEKKLPIGYVPAGSTNDFASSLHLPGTMKKAAQTVVDGSLFACDVGAFNEDRFVYIAAFGVFTDVSYGTKQEIKNVLGHTAYILEGVKSISAIKPFYFKVVYDGKTIEGDFIYGMVSNSDSVGGFKKITGKDVSLNDGVFEVTLIKMPKNPIELSMIAAALMNHDLDSEYIHCFKTSKITFESNQEVAWTLDGEFGGNHRRVCIENCAKAIQIVVPS